MLRRALIALATWPCLFLAAQAGPAVSTLTLNSCDPASVQTGDTVLLTIGGTMPSGSLTVEFFPQHINVASATMLDAHSLAVQVSVPFDAPAGNYNVLVYNQQGEESLGSALLTVGRPVRPPHITSAAPLEVEAGLVEFKLTLSSDVVDDAALSHLSVTWTRGGAAVPDITSTFARDAASAIGLTVQGTMLPGDAYGKLFFDHTPIFLIRLQRVGKEWSFFGHRPATIVADSPGCQVQLLGRGLSPLALSGAQAILALDGAEVTKVAVDWQDAARASVSFTPIPAPGNYSLNILQGDVLVYQGPLTILSEEQARAAASAQPPPSSSPTPSEKGSQAPAGAPPTPAGRDSRSRTVHHALPQWEQATAQPASGAASKRSPDGDGPTAVPGDQELAAQLANVQLEPEQIDPAKTVFKLKIHGLSLTGGSDGLSAKLTGDNGAESNLMFLAVDPDSLVLLFRAPDDGWQPQTHYLLRILNASGVEVFRREMAAVTSPDQGSPP